RLSLPRFAEGGIVGGGDGGTGLPDLPSRASRGDDFSATLNLQLGDRTYPTFTSRDVAAEVVKALKKYGANIR
ncbi:MAG: hypothetical protein GYA47_09525, partial [Desulfovibrio sp.]|nr:hypothetical protein [Desulfovibrio sp.]